MPPYFFQTACGDVTIARVWISHLHDGAMEIPSVVAQNTPHQLAITPNLRDTTCDPRRKRSAHENRADIGPSAGDEDVTERSTMQLCGLCT